MKIQIKNITVGVEQNQEKSLIKHIEKLGIKKEFIGNITYLKRSIDSRSSKS